MASEEPLHMNSTMTPHLASPAHTATSTTPSINKIVVVGHPLSGYEGVETLLNTCGMQQAAASQRDGLSAAQVGATLLKAHRILPLDALQPHGPIQPLRPGPIWQSLALDLLMGNLDHDLWGWSDPQAIYLLDYWKDLDPQLAFMLVYDTPQELIAHAFDNPAVACTHETVQTALDNWNAYNDTLLQFYHRNPQRCMLVHAEQVRARAADYLHQVQARIGAPLAPAPNSGGQASINNSIATQQAPGEQTTSLAAPLHPAEATPANTHHALRAYVAQTLLTQQPEALQRYEELQASATLPLAEHSQAPSADPALLALQAVVGLRKQQAQQQQKLAALEADKLELEAKLNEQPPTPPATPANDELQQENDLLLTQLHQVQEELERYYLENQRLKAKAPAPAKPAQPPAPYGAADRVKQQLSYRLGSKMIERSRTLGGWLGMPFALMGVARQYKRELPQRKATKQVPIEKYRDAYEAERVKQHLSYRLGTVLLKHGKNPLRWPALPFALQQARKAWRSQQTR